MSNPHPLQNFLFPPRPLPATHDYTQHCITNSLPSYLADLLAAEHQGIYYLAKKLWELNQDNPDLNSKVCDEPEALPAIMTILAQLSHEARVTIMNNQFQEFFKTPMNPDLRMPWQHQASIKNFTDGEAPNPVIYGLALCGHNGELPTVGELWGTLRKLKTYAKTSTTPQDWAAADALALALDENVGVVTGVGIRSDRKWAPTLAQRRGWTQDANGNPVAHPRRWIRS